MTTIPMRFTIIGLALSFATVAQGQLDDWYVAPSIVFNDDDGDRKIDDSLAGSQINIGWDMSTFTSLELLLGYSDIDGFYDFDGDGVYVFDNEFHVDISANLLAFYDRDSTFAPYVMVGVGYLGVNYNVAGNENRATGSLGVGFKWRMGQSNFSIRGEYRARLAYEKDNNLVDRLTTLGVQYNFGGRRPDPGVPPTNINIDTDGDGVLDIWDECPNTEKGVEVTSRGCRLENIDRDTDKDRVYDRIDECPNTPIGVPVDRLGCSLDGDMDGVTTDKDRCPGSRPGAEVDIFGCEDDVDRDGVPDLRDNCLNTRAGARIDVYGCEIRDVITLPGVNFKTGIDTLLPGTEYLLRDAANTLIKYPDMHIEVAGHTDSVGNADLNQGLSMRRAKTVRDSLIRYGVDQGRLTFRGYGESQPIADNTTADGRATNRRVELRLVNR